MQDHNQAIHNLDLAPFLPEPEPLITVEHLSIKIHDQTILEDLNFKILPTEIITIIGPNGAGKSTLLRAILGLIKPSIGKIIKNSQIKIGYMPQKIFFPEQIPLTVLSFLKLDHKEQIYALSDLLADHPALQLEHLLARSIHKLSGGELQRVLLAKALLNKPNLLILDEPTKSIDLNGQIEFYQLFADLQKKLNCAILMASHDLHIVMSEVNSVICLNKHICCHGLPATVSKHAEFIKLFGNNLNKVAFYAHKHDHKHE